MSYVIIARLGVLKASSAAATVTVLLGTTGAGRWAAFSQLVGRPIVAAFAGKSANGILRIITMERINFC